MRKSILILAIVSAFLMPGIASAQENGQGVIEGRVVNGTEGGGSVAGVELTLIAYTDEGIDTSRTTLSDSQGEFRFDDVSLDYEYLVSASYMDVVYYNQVVFDEGETTAYLEVGVCDTTDNDEMIHAALSHAVIEIGEESVEITEMFWLANDGDRTYIDDEGSLVFTLPGGAYGFDAPEQLFADFELLENNRLLYLVPFPPGERQIVFSYHLPSASSDELVFTLVMDYPADSFSLMVGSEKIGDIEVAAPPLEPYEPVTVDSGEQLIHLRGEYLDRGTPVNISLSGLSGSGGAVYIVLPVILAVAITIAVIYIMRKRKSAVSNE
jgi:hypothetical protein